MSYVNAPIHDLLIRIKNAYMARKKSLQWIVYSHFKEQVLSLLKKYRFISDYSVTTIDGKKFISVALYITGNLVHDIPVVSFYSTPSRKRYIWWKEIRMVAGWKGIGILSTSKWLMASHEAKALKIWWELIAEIY